MSNTILSADQMLLLEGACTTMVCDQVNRCGYCEATGYPRPKHTEVCVFDTDEEEGEPETKVLEFDLDPHQGAAGMVVKLAPVGYEFESMDRKGTKVKATYRRRNS